MLIQLSTPGVGRRLTNRSSLHRALAKGKADIIGAVKLSLSARAYQRQKQQLPSRMKIINSLIVGILLTLTGCSYHKTVVMGSESSIVHKSGPMGFDVIASDEGIILHEGDRLTTPGAFRPPVEINVLAKTDSTNIRLVYAADQLIFNWENDLEQLRVDGGPAHGRHKAGAGSIPKDRFVAIKWLVSRTNQAVYVDNELRFEHQGDYSTINRAVSVFPAAGSTVTVKSLSVRRASTSPR